MAIADTTTPIDMQRPVPLRIAIGWGAGGSVLGAAAFVRVLVLGFLVDYIGIAPSIAAFLIAGANIYDAVLDPGIGVVSDRTRSRWGRRYPFMAAGSIGLMVAWYMLFNVPATLGGPLLLFYVMAGLLVYSTAYGLFGVPYNAIPAELTDDYHSRSFLMALRTGFFVLGTSMAGYLGPTFITKFGGGRIGHGIMADFMGLLTAALGLMCIGLMRGARLYQADHVKTKFKDQARTLLKNRHFFLLLACFIMVTLGSTTSNVAGIFYARRVLGAGDEWFAHFYLLLNVFMIGSLPAWLVVGRRLGKRNTYIIGAMMVSLSAASWYWAKPGEPFLYLTVRTFFIGAGSSALLTMLNSMLPDTIEFDRLMTGLRREGVYAGLFTTTEKGTTALGVALTGLVLSATGYVQSSHGDSLKQSADALNGIFIAFAVVPAITIFLSAALMLFYNLSEASLAEARAAAPRDSTLGRPFQRRRGP